jgi:hypothetical protein
VGTSLINKNWIRLPYLDGVTVDDILEDHSYSRQTHEAINRLYEARIHDLLEHIHSLHPDNKKTVRFETEKDLGLDPTGLPGFVVGRYIDEMGNQHSLFIKASNIMVDLQTLQMTIIDPE